MDYARAHYDDGSVACDETGLAIRRYYPWGARRILYGEIRDLRVLPLSTWAAVQPWHLWGPADLEHWWSLDVHRPERRTAVVLDTGERFKPTVTPVDPDGFEKVLRAHLSVVPRLRAVAAQARLDAQHQALEEETRVPEPRVPSQREVLAMVPEPTTRVRS
jgi:hypothetical protein